MNNFIIEIEKAMNTEKTKIKRYDVDKIWTKQLITSWNNEAKRNRQTIFEKYGKAKSFGDVPKPSSTNTDTTA